MTEQAHHDVNPCYDQDCRLNHPHGGPFPHPCSNEGEPVTDQQEWNVGDTARLGNTVGKVIRVNTLTMTIEIPGNGRGPIIVTASRRKFTNP